jgi:hypothetical protein
MSGRRRGGPVPVATGRGRFSRGRHETCGDAAASSARASSVSCWGDERAAVYEIGAIWLRAVEYRDWYDFEHVLVLGRVMMDRW